MTTRGGGVIIDDEDDDEDDEDEEDDDGDSYTNVALTEANFPDAAFRKYVSDTYDEDGNGELSSFEVILTSDFNMSNLGITTLKGLELLPYAENLVIDGNPVTELDVSANPDLEKLSCNNTQLTALDVSGHVFLTTLECSTETLETLNAKNCESLETLKVGGCTALKTLVVGGCESLAVLDAHGCSIGAIDLKSCEMLETVNVNGCESLKKLEVSGCTALKKVNVSGCTALKTLEVSGCTALTALNVRGCQALAVLNAAGCPIGKIDLTGCMALKKAIKKAIKEYDGSAKTCACVYSSAGVSITTDAGTQVMLGSELQYPKLVASGKTSRSVTVGKYITLGVGVNVKDYPEDVKWTSVNSMAAIVTKKGKVTGKKAGSTIVTAKADRLGSVNFEVTVKAPSLKKPTLKL